MSKDHFTHSFSDDAQLVMTEYSFDRFDVTYLTREGMDEDGRWQWFANNSDVYKSFSDAKAGFNKRRNSEEPFKALSR